MMQNENRILPAGIQSFKKLREQHCVYVDKTEYIESQAKHFA
jgi:hypothetical protein